MNAVPTLRGSVGCSACRFSALRLFVRGFAATANTKQLAPASPAIRASRHLPRTSTRKYSALRTTPSRLAGPSIEEDATKETSETDKNARAAAPTPESDVPWYLQVEPPKHPALLHEPPPLPDIPEGSPKLMEPLVKFVSDEIGLDDLNLLDLRELDPPAAIGPDLLMLFGTARSERHLHVSADRLVRWLRGRGIHAKADGLIGRNILKIRLKRKARKEKLLGSSGAARSADDGITTGWICVNVGTVGRSDTEVEILDEHGNSTGFGVPAMGTTVVVQMMTESRRQELDLEKLWGDKLRRGLERNSPRAPLGDLGKSDQTRDNGLLGSGKRAEFSGDSFAAAFHRRHFSTAHPARKAPESLATTKTSALDKDMASIMKAAELQSLLEDDDETKLYVLGHLEDLLARQSLSDAAKHVGNPKESPIMQLYHRALDGLSSSASSPTKSLPSRLRLELLGRAAGVETHTIHRLRTLFREIQLTTGVHLTRSEYLNILRTIYAYPRKTDDDTEVRDQSSLAAEVIDCMFTRGYSVMENDVIAAVIEGLVVSKSASPEAQRVLSQFEEFLFEYRMPCPSDPLLVNLLEAYGRAGEWDKFWRVWRIPPQRYMRRSRTLYTYVFRRFADDGHRVRALDAVRWCFEEMRQEVPPVLAVGGVRAALEACLRVADPTSEAVARSVKPVSGRNSGILGERECVRIWHGLWKRV